MKKLKAVFCSINSKYIHSSLGVWYLFASAEKLCSENVEVSVVEGTINEKEDILFQRLRDTNADVIAFSVYIWNIRTVLSLSEKLKNEGIKIILGGPREPLCRK